MPLSHTVGLPTEMSSPVFVVVIFSSFFFGESFLGGCVFHIIISFSLREFSLGNSSIFLPGFVLDCRERV